MSSLWLELGMPLIALLGTYGYYVGFSYYLQRSNYYSKASKQEVQEWKCQPEKGHVGPAAKQLWWPIFSPPRPDKPADYTRLTFLNLTQAALFAALVALRGAKGQLSIYWEIPAEQSWLQYAWTVLCDTLLAVGHQCVIEHYWHLLMHTRFFYARCHKLHHHFQAPEVFDDFYIHPLESLGYQCILWSPAFLYRMHVVPLALYLSIMSVFGVTDHSGVRITVKLPVLGWTIYSSEEHDLHHELFECNYGFPFLLLDKLHGTYRAPKSEAERRKEAEEKAAAEAKKRVEELKQQ